MPLVFSLPLPVWSPVQSGVPAAVVNVEHVLAGLRLGSGARVAAKSRVFAAERVAGHAAQEVDLRAVGLALVGHAFGEHGERRRIAGGVRRALDRALLGGALVGVERPADLAQRMAEILLLVALHGHFG